MVLLRDFTAWLDDRLKLREFSGDVSNNGLQIEGRPEVRRAVFSVDASLALFEAAAEREADFIFVHHGLSWGAEPRRLTGTSARRYRLLFERGMSLYAAHLPLDAAPVFGNNAVLSRLIGLCNLRPFFCYDGAYIGFSGELTEPETMEKLRSALGARLNCRAQLFGSADRLCCKVAVVSGGGGLEAVEAAAEAGVDLLLTGELTHVMYHCALECGVAVLALGHYASETTGPRALMELATSELELEAEFVDLPTGL